MASINEIIANAIVSEIDGVSGTFSVEVEKDGITMVADGSFEIDGYREDDYFSGTGAWVTTSITVSVDSVEAYNEDGETVDVDCDLSAIEKSVKYDLAA